MTHVLLPGRRVFLLIVLLVFPVVLFAQQSVDFNEYYYFPVSAGAEFRSLSALDNEIARDSSVTEFASIARYPLPFFPSVQPFLKLGFVNVNWLRDEVVGSRDHRQVFAEVGAAYAHRFSKNFEGGGALSVGFGQSYLPNLLGDDVTYRSDNFVAMLAGSVSLNPSYSFSIEAKPALRYERVLQGGIPDWDFSGLSFGLGFAVHYRFGDDPDEQTLIESIRFSEAEIDPVFAAMQSWYVDNPIGSIQLTNVEAFPIESVQIEFFQPDKMDTPTETAFVDVLEPEESTTVDLTAVFNSKIFDTLGEQQISGEVIATYTYRTRRVSQRHPVNFSLLDGSAITWDDDNKAGAFITPSDSAIRNYSSYVRQVGRQDVVPGFSQDLQVAMQLYYAMKEQGLIYQVDPNTPFTEMQEQTTFVDSVSVARETLARGTGDCDDLTVLYNTLLETVGVKTGYITTPGHIYSAFSTGLPPDRYREIHPDPRMTVEIDGELWVPVEITLVDTGDFLAAWRYGIEEYGTYGDAPELRGFYKTAEAQAVYQPVALKQEDAGLQYAPGNQIVSNFKRGMDRLIEAIIDDYAAAAESSGRKRDYNQLGIASAEYGRFATAERAFNTALSLDRNYLSPLINLGNVYFMQEQYQSALRNYHRAEETLLARNRQGTPTFQSLLLNIAKSYHALENFDRAQQYYDTLREINPDMAARNTYLEESQGRASRAQQGPGIEYVDPEEED